MGNPTLVICTVGGSEGAVAAAIKGCGPERVIFVPSPQTKDKVELVLQLLLQENIILSPGQFDISPVPDAQDFTACVEKMKELGSEVSKWIGKGQEYRVIVDFTAGTKCMSAALALVARRWPCQFSYVGGTERTKGGVGIVIDGKENVLHTQNPWDSLGYQAVEDGTVFFNQGDYQAATSLLGGALQRIERPDLKAEVNVLKMLAEAYLAWDQFDHDVAHSKLGEVVKNSNNLRHSVLHTAEDLLEVVNRHRAFLFPFKERTRGRHEILDLCANARRCATRGRYDDAVARLYRAIEAIAQLRLNNQHGIPNTGEAPLEKVPESLRLQWVGKARDGGLSLALQDDYRLLEALGDDLGKRFYALRLIGKESALSARNLSILAHGFTPVGKKVFDSLWDATLKLAEISDAELPVFPKIA